jgi:hypothetical protein
MSILVGRPGATWRTIAVLLAAILAGVIIGRLDVGGVASGAIEPATTAKWANCVGFGAYPHDGKVEWRSEAVFRNARANTFLFCPLSLPDGVTITAVKFHVNDEEELADVGPCYVSRMQLDPPDGDYQRLAGPRSTTGTPGYTVLTDSTIQHGVVDNRYFAYWGECTMTGDDDMGVVAISVRYHR